MLEIPHDFREGDFNELALCAGGGGGLLGSTLLGWRTVCAVEIREHCQNQLLERQREGFLDTFPIWDDMYTFDGRPWNGVVDIITGGIPCTPFSTAAGRGEYSETRKGEADERNLWPETLRIVREVRPRFCLFENVRGLLSSNGYFGWICKELSTIGYNVRWTLLQGYDVGAPHARSRLWLFAHPYGQRLERALQPRLETGERGVRQSARQPADIRWWNCEPEVERVGDRFPDRMDELISIGNAQIPAMVARAWHVLTGEM